MKKEEGILEKKKAKCDIGRAGVQKNVILQ